MAATNTPLAEIMALALRLSPLDKVRLLEQIASTLERDLAVQPAAESSEKRTWGEQLVALVEQLDLRGWEAADDDDPVEWVARQRQVQMRERHLDWDSQS